MYLLLYYILIKSEFRARVSTIENKIIITIDSRLLHRSKFIVTAAQGVLFSVYTRYRKLAWNFYQRRSMIRRDTDQRRTNALNRLKHGDAAGVFFLSLPPSVRRLPPMPALPPSRPGDPAISHSNLLPAYKQLPHHRSAHIPESTQRVYYTTCWSSRHVTLATFHPGR